MRARRGMIRRPPRSGRRHLGMPARGGHAASPRPASPLKYTSTCIDRRRRWGFAWVARHRRGQIFLTTCTACDGHGACPVSAVRQRGGTTQGSGRCSEDVAFARIRPGCSSYELQASPTSRIAWARIGREMSARASALRPPVGHLGSVGSRRAMRNSRYSMLPSERFAAPA